MASYLLKGSAPPRSTQAMRLFLPHHPPTRRASPGNSLAPVLIIVAALGISTAIFFFYTKKKIGQETSSAVASADASSDSPDAPGAPASTAPATAPGTAPATTPTAKPTPAPKPTYGFARPLDLGKQMASSLAAGDFGAAGGLASASNPAQADMAAQMFQKLAELGYKPGTEDQVELLGLVENRTRLSLPLTRPGMDGTARLQLDLERDERMGWKIAKIILPKDASAVEVLKKRTLTNLYNGLNAWRGIEKMRIKPEAADFAPRLDDLHQALDRAVCEAYGWSDMGGEGYAFNIYTPSGEEEILRRVLALNLARTGG